MGRNRVIYQSEALFVNGITQVEHEGLASSDQLLRVQDISHGVELNRTDVNEFGQLAAIDRKIIEPPTVNLEFSYYLHGGRNEDKLGFNQMTGTDRNSAGTLTNALGNFLSGDSGKNYYISVSAEGDDNKTTLAGDQQGVIGIGNGVIASYSVEAAVGAIPTASVSVEANNIRFTDTGKAISNPAVDPATGVDMTGTLTNFPIANETAQKSGDNPVSCLQPGDVIVDFSDDGNMQPSDGSASDSADSKLGGARLEGDGQCHLQNFTIDIPMARTALTRLGNKFPYAREMEVPLNITFTCSAFLADIENGNLNDLVCGDQQKRNIRVKMMQPCTSGSTASTTLAQEWLLKGCTLDSQNFSASIGDNKTVDLVFSLQSGGANDDQNGVFMWKQGGTFSSGEAVENPRG